MKDKWLAAEVAKEAVVPLDVAKAVTENLKKNVVDCVD